MTYEQEYKKRIYNERKAAHKCTHCGKRLRSDSRFVKCVECLAKHKKYMRSLKAKERLANLTMEQQVNKMFYEQLKKDKKCVTCGTTLDKAYPYIRCEFCLSKARASQKKCREKSK